MTELCAWTPHLCELPYYPKISRFLGWASVRECPLVLWLRWMVYCGALARVEEKEYMNNCMICLICLIVTQVHSQYHRHFSSLSFRIESLANVMSGFVAHSMQTLQSAGESCRILHFNENKDWKSAKALKQVLKKSAFYSNGTFLWIVKLLTSSPQSKILFSHAQYVVEHGRRNPVQWWSNLELSLVKDWPDV